MRESLVSAFGVHTGISHGVHGVGAAAPALLRTVGIEWLGQRKCLPGGDQGRGFDALRRIDEIQGAQDIIRTPATPVVVGSGHDTDAAKRVGTPHYWGIS
ncbi:hypothetical protein D3C74_452270 [compost metagenome]